MLNIDEATLRETIAQRAADQLLDDDAIAEEVRKKVDLRISKLFADRVDKLISDAIDEAFRNGLEREYARVNSWGEKQGETTTIKKELEHMIGRYWSARVNSSNGKETDSSYNSVSRAEYVMMTVCGAKFNEDMKQVALNVTGHLKDGLRNQMAAHMDNILNDLFRVKSLQDQGKVVKPY